MSIYTFGSNPDSEFETGVLKGFYDLNIHASDYESERASALYVALEALEADEDTEYVLGVLPDGKWALVGLAISGYAFVIED